MSAFTPGPWRSGGATTKAGRNLRQVSAPTRHLFDMRIHDDEDLANARLVAAAPELYEALRAVRYGAAQSILTSAFEALVSVIDAALARAEGRQVDLPASHPQENP